MATCANTLDECRPRTQGERRRLQILQRLSGRSEQTHTHAHTYTDTQRWLIEL